MRRVLIAGSFLLLATLLVVWLGRVFGDEVTVYKMFCTGGRAAGECHSKEETANPTTYRVSIDRQFVVYWIDDSAPVRFPYCAVRDKYNWSCKYEGANVIPEREYVMDGGQYYENLLADPHPVNVLFYQASPWHWWSVWLVEKLRK